MNLMNTVPIIIMFILYLVPAEVTQRTRVLIQLGTEVRIMAYPHTK